mgnify:CR=1 FL=1
MDDHKDYFIDTDDDRETPRGDTATGTPEIEFDSHGGTTRDSGSPDGGLPSGHGRHRRHRFRTFILWLLLIVIFGGGLTFYIRYLTPYVEEAQVRGYIVSVERRGIFFKTYEGVMATESALVDTAAVYQRDMTFSVSDPAVVAKLRDYQGSGQPVTLTYERYYGSLPWRGASTIVATDVSTNQ